MTMLAALGRRGTGGGIQLDNEQGLSGRIVLRRRTAGLRGKKLPAISQHDRSTCSTTVLNRCGFGVGMGWRSFTKSSLREPITS